MGMASIFFVDNYALNKQASMSGYDSMYPFATGDKMVDGDDNTDFHNGQSCSFPYRSAGRLWWQVDLESLIYIHRVQIVNRDGKWGYYERSLSSSCHGEGLNL